MDQGVLKDLGDAFFLFAYDSSGKVRAPEVGPVVRSIGLNPTEEELKEICGMVDRQYGGAIDAQSLAKLLQGRLGALQTSGDELKDAFGVFDKNGNGMITVGDLRHSLTCLGERLPDKIVEEVIREVNPDGEESVSIDDLVRLLMQK